MYSAVVSACEPLNFPIKQEGDWCSSSLLFEDGYLSVFGQIIAIAEPYDTLDTSNNSFGSKSNG